MHTLTHLYHLWQVAATRVHGRHILEVGAGCGLCGLLAAQQVCTSVLLGVLPPLPLHQPSVSAFTPHPAGRMHF